jgi:hypothetical protein
MKIDPILPLTVELQKIDSGKESFGDRQPENRREQ